MLEIDGVKVAIESGLNWELGDELADRFEQVVELATTTPMTDKSRSSINWRIDLLREHDLYVSGRLTDAEEIPSLEGVTIAYRSVLSQVSNLARQQGSNTVQ